MSKPVIEFYYDVVSPYSYLGFVILEKYERLWNVDLQVKPFFLGGVMQAAGNQPPATLPAKATYLSQDIQRLSQYWGVHLQFPEQFPLNTLLAQRFLQALLLGKSI